MGENFKLDHYRIDHLIGTLVPTLTRWPEAACALRSPSPETYLFQRRLAPVIPMSCRALPPFARQRACREQEICGLSERDGG